MHCKTLLVAFALSATAAAAPFPNQLTNSITSISDLVGSPFANGNGNGNGNAAGNNNDGNAAGNGAGNGNKNGNDNIFGNKNSILSGNSGIGARNDAVADMTKTIISGLTGSPFGNGNGNGNGNSAGNGNDGNAAGNGVNNGNGNGNGNIFGNGNDILSGNKGIGKVRRANTLGSYVGTIIDSATTPLVPGNPNSFVGSPSGNGNSNGNGNTAGSNNDGNGSGNGANNGNGNGNGNSFGNSNNILSGNSGLGPISVAPVIDPSLTIG